MKKKLFLFATAALVLASCNNDVTISENTALVGSNAQKEIAFTPYAKTPKRAADVAGAIEGTAFPTDLDMIVAAWEQGATGRDYFDATEFKYNYAAGASGASHGYWGGLPARYWPLAPCYINFLAIANAYVTTPPTDIVWGVENAAYASQVVVNMADNYAITHQHDFLYAIGHGEVTKSGNALIFPDKVDMTFKHAQSYLTFRVKAADLQSQDIKIKDIQIYGARFNGTATIIQTNHNAQAGQATTLQWAAGDPVNDWKSVLDNQTAFADEEHSTALTADFVRLGKIMVVPNMDAVDHYQDNGTTKIKITYYLNSKDYAYEYEISDDTYEAGKKYIYDITFKLHEIFIEPVVVDWEDKGQFIDIPTYAVGKNYNYGTISGKASTYQFAIAGLTGAAPAIAASDGSAAFATTPSITAAGVATFSVTANFTNAAKNYSLTVTDAGDGHSGKASVITFSQDKFAVPYVANGVATVTIPNAAGTYYFDITGITTADNYLMAEGEDGTDFITAVTPNSNTAVAAGGSLAVSVTITSSTGNSRPIILKNDGDEELMTIIVKQQ